jgi:hypothetical protein
MAILPTLHQVYEESGLVGKEVIGEAWCGDCVEQWLPRSARL